MGVKIRKGGEWVTCTGDFSGKTRVAFIEHREDSTVDSLGTFPQNTWVTRELTHKVDPNSMVTFPVATDSASDKTQWSLEKGSYRIKWSAPAFRCDRNQTKLVYANDATFANPFQLTDLLNLLLMMSWYKQDLLVKLY